MKTLFLHEDFYKQIELIPEENIFTIISTNEMTVDFDSYGYDNIIERDKNKVELAKRKIRIDQIENTLSELVYLKYHNIYKGYGDSAKLMTNTIAYGFERFAIFFEYDNEHLIKNIWLNQDTEQKKDNTGKNLLLFLYNLGKMFDLILVDWNEENIIRLKNKQKIKEYLNTTYYFDID